MPDMYTFELTRDVGRDVCHAWAQCEWHLITISAQQQYCNVPAPAVRQIKMSSFLSFFNFWASCCVGTVSKGSACQPMSSVTVFLPVSGGISPQRWIKLKRLVSKPLPKMINPRREYYGLLSGCAFSLPVIVLFLLLPSSVSLPFIWKEEKNAWIEEGAFPTVTQLRKIRHCHRVPIPVPCWTVHWRWQTALPNEWPFFPLFEKWWRS